MSVSKVYFTDFYTQAYGDSLPTKLQKMIRAAGIGELDMEGKFVAIKMHFGELGNVSFLRPNYARAVVDVVKELGGKPQIDAGLCRGCKRCQRECVNNGLFFDGEKKKMTVDLEHCLGCGRCIGACSFDAISFTDSNAVQVFNCRMAEYAKAVVDGRPQFHISLVVDVSPNCDCHAENDVPILPNIGMFASFDPLALDQACVDACLAAEPLPSSQLANNMAAPDFHDHHDHFVNSTPESEWRSCLEHAEKIGIGSREYELISI